MARRINFGVFGFLFGGGFLCIGLIMGFALLGKPVYEYFATSNWVTVPATLDRIELIASEGDGTKTYFIDSRYSYEYNGDSYVNDRVELGWGRDSVKSYWTALESRLKKDQASGEAYAFVNPDNPRQALLDRTLRWSWLLFGLVLGGLFTGIGAYAIRWSRREHKRRNALGRSARDPHDRDYRNPADGIKSDATAGAWFSLLFGSFFVLMGILWAIDALPDAIGKKDYVALLSLFFIVVGLSFVFFGMKLRSIRGWAESLVVNSVSLLRV